MRAIAVLLAGLLAAGGLIVAELCPLLTIVDTNTILWLPRMLWGGGGRIWMAAGLMAVATILWGLNARRWPAFLAGITLGILVDIAFSALQWRDEQFARLKILGLTDFTPTIDWQPGTPGLLIAVVCVLLFFFQSSFPSRPPAPAATAPAKPAVPEAESNTRILI
jgi:hypothetical protein